ncbi:MAG: putative metal-dependent phosphoesterase TrpH [Gammaproteobacteria bacterium]|jgi:predicted metal-dependent phosphoesterase TrpH
MKCDMTVIDLHSHSDKSDGALCPNELLQHAAAAGVEVLSITDHDTLAAYPDVEQAAGSVPQLIPGVEFSTEWRKTGIHVLGLNIDLTSAAIEQATSIQAKARLARAEQIAAGLERLGVPDPLAGALTFAGKSAIGRPHFANYLVECGFVKDVGQAFRKYLGAGKVGDVKQHWSSLEQIISWIRDAGGTAVIAHPGKYGLTRTRRVALIEDFKQLGGGGIEVISGHQDAPLTASLAASASAAGLLASCGSDFHRPGQPWARLGMPLDLPAECKPVWDAW